MQQEFYYTILFDEDRIRSTAESGVNQGCIFFVGDKIFHAGENLFRNEEGASGFFFLRQLRSVLL